MIHKKVTYGILGGVVLLAGCFGKPYHVYKKTYKTDQARVYADGTIKPSQAIKKSIKHMNLAQARAARLYFEGYDDTDLIEKCLMHIIKISDNYQEKGECLYQLATIHLSLGRLEKARELFDQLIADYPGISVKKEACYRRLLAHYWDRSDEQRDQSITTKTLNLLKEFNENFPDCTEYRTMLDMIEDDCYKLLIKAELLRMDFYLARYRVSHQLEALTAAQMRLGYILESLLEHQRHITSEYKDMLCDLFIELKALGTNDVITRYQMLEKAYRLVLDAKHEN